VATVSSCSQTGGACWSRAESDTSLAFHSTGTRRPHEKIVKCFDSFAKLI